MVCTPAPAAAGSKLLPLIPGPLKVPPDGVPVNVTDASVEQYVVARPVKPTFNGPGSETV